LTNPAFENSGDIPARYRQVAFEVPVDQGTFVCVVGQAGSENISPELSWSNVPLETVSLALVMGDQMSFAYPDMPADAIFTHWVLYNLPPQATGLPEGIASDADLADGA
jgi:phosphatidylethanolamine-binding protein (PEBP) family uncharacterized protein